MEGHRSLVSFLVLFFHTVFILLLLKGTYIAFFAVYSLRDCIFFSETILLFTWVLSWPVAIASHTMEAMLACYDSNSACEDSISVAWCVCSLC